MVTNPYKILDIPETATDEEVKSAYRKLAKKYHPDKYVDSPLKDVADEKMKEINEAYYGYEKEQKFSGPIIIWFKCRLWWSI